MKYNRILSKIFTENIVIVELVAERNYTKIITNAKTFLVSKNLKFVLDLIAQDQPSLRMIRCNRGLAINFDFIRIIGNDYYYNDNVIEVSRRKAQKTKQIVNEILNSNRTQ